MVNLYQEALLDHYRHPRHRGILAGANFSSGVHNPSCGDTVSMQGQVQEEIVCAVAFEGSGCVISQAAASMLCEYVRNKSVQLVKQLGKKSVTELIGIELGPTRLRCALLPLEALHKGLSEYQERT